MAARRWTEEQRAQQALKIREWQPWEKSTGARTSEGKAVSARNAFKGGLRKELMELTQLLREQRNMLNELV